MTRWVAWPLFLLAAAAAATEAPRIDIEPGRRLVLAALPPIVDEAEVREHLTTGLTTGFLFRVSVRDPAGGRPGGGARIEIRYELWDEVYHVAAVGIDGAVERRTVASTEELRAWWSSLRLLVLEAPPGLLGRARQAKVQLDVVPFSQTERDDTQRWFSDSLDKAGRSSTEELGQSYDEQPEVLSRAFNLLMATSIGSRALTSYRWSVALPRRDAS